MRWLDGIINSMDEFEQTQGDSEEQGSCSEEAWQAAVYGAAKTWT